MNDHQYSPLLGEVYEHEKDATPFPVASLSSRRRRLALWATLIVETIAIICLVSLLWAGSRAHCPVNPVYPQVLYSPAQEALEYQAKTFNMGFSRHKTIYQGEPSDEVDKAWEDLYNSFGLSQIPKAQARLLPNKTLPILGDEENYAVGLAVFHQLHCLNSLRKGLNPEYYRDPVTGAISNIAQEDWPEHASHCVDNIRQSLMCASDISLVVWQWVEAANQASVKMNTVHSCRNFDRIVDWAKAHRLQSPLDLTVYVEDDIVIPTF